MRSSKSDRAAMMMMMVVMRAYMQQRPIQLFRRPCFVSTLGDREILRQLVLPLQLLLDVLRASLRPPTLPDELASRRLTVTRSDFSSLLRSFWYLMPREERIRGVNHFSTSCPIH
jgi:hypothetical protein